MVGRVRTRHNGFVHGVQSWIPPRLGRVAWQWLEGFGLRSLGAFTKSRFLEVPRWSCEDVKADR